MKEMLANRCDKKSTKVFPVDSGKSICMIQTLITVREYLIAWRSKTILLTKPPKDCKKICKFSLLQ